MRIFYHLSTYISHRSSGCDYMDCLRLLGHELSADPAILPEAEVAILHDEPLLLPSLFAAHPQLERLRSIALCVWENERLPLQYEAPLRLVDELWTPSRFSQKALQQCFPQTALVPHVVRRQEPSEEDLAFARHALRIHEPGFRFFSIVDSLNPRKNLSGLLRAFAALRAMCADPVYLVLKQYRGNRDIATLPGVISIQGDLTHGQIAALHRTSDAYVSAHHAEGWGLGLSEAMAWGKPVIATAYSGNMEFMDVGNSLPVPYALVPVSDEMCRMLPLFRPDMRWAEIDQAALVRAMRRVAAGRVPEDLPRKAAAITQRFGPRKVASLMQGLLDAR